MASKSWNMSLYILKKNVKKVLLFYILLLYLIISSECNGDALPKNFEWNLWHSFVSATNFVICFSCKEPE